MVVKPSALSSLSTQIRTQAREVEQNSDDHDILTAMQNVQKEAAKIENALDATETQHGGMTLVNDDLADALRGTGIMKHQTEISQQIMSVIASSGFPTQPGVKEPFETLLDAAKQLESQFAELGLDGDQVLQQNA